MAFLDQAREPHGLQVAAHRGRADADSLRELARRTRPFGKKIDYAAALRIGQRRQRVVDTGEFCAHFSSSVRLTRPMSEKSDGVSKIFCRKFQT